MNSMQKRDQEGEKSGASPARKGRAETDRGGAVYRKGTGLYPGLRRSRAAEMART